MVNVPSVYSLYVALMERWPMVSPGFCFRKSWARLRVVGAAMVVVLGLYKAADIQGCKAQY